MAIAAKAALRWWQGYGVDVTAGLEMYFPLVYMAFVGVPLIVAAIAAFRMLQYSTPIRKRVAFLSISACIALLQFAVPSLTMAGFKTRMSQFNESEFLVLDDSIRFLHDAQDSRLDQFGERIVRALQNSQPLLRVSTWTPKIFVGQESTEVRWGSGLTGALAVEVSKRVAKSSVSKDEAISEPLYSCVRLLEIY